LIEAAALTYWLAVTFITLCNENVEYDIICGESVFHYDHTHIIMPKDKKLALFKRGLDTPLCFLAPFMEISFIQRESVAKSNFSAFER